MFKKYFISAIFISLLFSSQLLFAEEKTNTSVEENLNVEEARVWDFGVIKEGEVKNHEFDFKNEGSTPLKILDVGSSCGCTISEIKKKLLAPGESTKLNVKFNSKTYKGKINQFVFVTTDDENNPVVKFVIKAEVK